MNKISFYLWWLWYTTVMGLAFVLFLAVLGIEVRPWRTGAAFTLLIIMIEVHAARRWEKRRRWVNPPP
jgi:hypothetical protein